MPVTQQQADQATMDITHTLQLLANASAGITTAAPTTTPTQQPNVVAVQGAQGTMGQAFIQGNFVFGIFERVHSCTPVVYSIQFVVQSKMEPFKADVHFSLKNI